MSFQWDYCLPLTAQYNHLKGHVQIEIFHLIPLSVPFRLIDPAKLCWPTTMMPWQINITKTEKINKQKDQIRVFSYTTIVLPSAACPCSPCQGPSDPSAASGYVPRLPAVPSSRRGSRRTYRPCGWPRRRPGWSSPCPPSDTEKRIRAKDLKNRGSGSGGQH